MKSLKAVMMVAAMMVAGTAMAGSVDGDQDMKVEANVLEVCQIESVGDINFGDYDALTDIEKTVQIKIQCTKSSAGGPTLSLDVASGGKGQMSNLDNTSSATLEYGLEYDGTDIGTGVLEEIDIKGTLAKGQWDAEKGAYLDTLTVTITF